MNKIVVSLVMLFSYAALFAQQPPAQLPSLLDGMDAQYLVRVNEKPEDIIRKNIFVKVAAAKNTVYTGEPLLVTYKLYTALSSQARVSKQPAFTGCSVLELYADKDPHDETVNGKNFHVFTIRKVLVTPLQEGTLQLNEAAVEIVAPLANAKSGNVDNFSATLTSKPLSVTVKALPVINKPKDFSGLVGNFNITANVDSNNIPVGENVVLHIRIKGDGNIAGIRSPLVQWPTGTEHFDGSDTQYVDVENYPVNGFANFDIPFIGTGEGAVTIPAVLFSYFDASQQAYKTISSQPLAVTFTKALSHEEQMKDIVTEDITNKKYLWIVGAIALTVISGLVLSSYFKQKKASAEKLLKSKQPATVLPEVSTEATKNDTAEIFTALNSLGALTSSNIFLLKCKSFLVKALQARLNTNISNEQQLAVMLKKNNEFAEVSQTCEHIFDTCNRNLYSPLADDNIQEQLYFELTAAVKKMFNFS
ncbi:MAG: BatD family protein [Panacibacter sp.]